MEIKWLVILWQISSWRKFWLLTLVWQRKQLHNSSSGETSRRGSGKTSRRKSMQWPAIWIWKHIKIYHVVSAIICGPNNNLCLRIFISIKLCVFQKWKWFEFGWIFWSQTSLLPTPPCKADQSNGLPWKWIRLCKWSKETFQLIW